MFSMNECDFCYNPHTHVGEFNDGHAYYICDECAAKYEKDII
jgi:hypothetical protein